MQLELRRAKETQIHPTEELTPQATLTLSFCMVIDISMYRVENSTYQIDKSMWKIETYRIDNSTWKIETYRIDKSMLKIDILCIE